MTTTEITTTPSARRSALVTVQQVADPAGTRVAVRLLEQQRRWLVERGLDPFARRPAARDEYTRPDRFYGWPDGALLVGYVGAKPAGVAGVLLDGSDRAELRRIFVLPEERRLGLGRLLLRAAVEAAEQLGAAQVVLETRPRVMPDAQALYRKAGFEPMPQQLRQRLDGAVGMRLPLVAVRRPA